LDIGFGRLFVVFVFFDASTAFFLLNEFIIMSNCKGRCLEEDQQASSHQYQSRDYRTRRTTVVAV
jgi:hypothetical protein